MSAHQTTAVDWLAVAVERMAAIDLEQADDLANELRIERARLDAELRPRLLLPMRD